MFIVRNDVRGGKRGGDEFTKRKMRFREERDRFACARHGGENKFFLIRKMFLLSGTNEMIQPITQKWIVNIGVPQWIICRRKRRKEKMIGLDVRGFRSMDRRDDDGTRRLNIVVVIRQHVVFPQTQNLRYDDVEMFSWMIFLPLHDVLLRLRWRGRGRRRRGGGEIMKMMVTMVDDVIADTTKKRNELSKVICFNFFKVSGQ